MPDPKDDKNAPSNQNKGSGSDTVSAANISAGTSVGTTGQSPPMPGAQGAGNPAQSSTLASHTSNPLGGQSAAGKDQQHSSTPGQGGQSTGRDAMSSGQRGPSSGQQNRGSSQGGGRSQGSADTMRQTADQVRDKAGQAYEEASDWMRDTYESASSWASDAMEPGGGRRSLQNARRGVQTYVAQNPVMVGLVGLAAGLLLGALLPRTRREDETFGQWADEVREQGLRYAHQMTQRGREALEEGFSGDDERFSRHESELGPGPGANRTTPGANRH
jgi:ElaB/YqjD/DUF883 family membrane-anchored ribosome-binding protein